MFLPIQPVARAGLLRVRGRRLPWVPWVAVASALGTACGGAGAPADDTDTDTDGGNLPVHDNNCHDGHDYVPPPACGSGPVDRGALLPGPGAAGYDAALAAKALRIERQFHALAAWSTGVNTEFSVPVDDAAGRAAVQAFVDGDGWDFEAVTGQSPDAVVSWQKAAGGYAGVGVAADALRYGVLRDEGAACDEVDRARENLLAGLEGLHRAVAITGVPGVIARGYARTDVPGYGQVVQTVPLFDDQGSPLPAEKDNGTWRADQSGDYPDYVWEDSCSRDMYMGWVTGMAFAWEVIRDDPTVDLDLRRRLREDARSLGSSLSTVQSSGYDLEIMDADGRRTYHGILHEESIDRAYVPGVGNGQNAMMSLGAAAALAMVSSDAVVNDWLRFDLVYMRELDEIALETAGTADLSVGSNFSGYNMNFLGGLLGVRYLCDRDARETLAQAVDVSQYAIDGHTRQPAEQGQTLYDLTAYLARGRRHLHADGVEVDAAMLDVGLSTLQEWAEPPAYMLPVDLCDGDEARDALCVAEDGTVYHSLGLAGRGDTLVAVEPVAMRHRPPSNYYWRSNPYSLKSDGAPDTVAPGVDFRLAYWLGRWVRR